MHATAACGPCKSAWDEPWDLPADLRLPCPHCVSTARAFTVDAVDRIVVGATATAVAYGVVTQASILLQAVIVPSRRTGDGRLIESIKPAWSEIARLMQRDPSAIYRIDARKREEIFAGAYKNASFHEVVLTPRSGDQSRDVIAVKRGLWTVRIIDQVKAYHPGHLVPADDVRALVGVLLSDRAATKGW
jgi:restriction system protein